jgi:hypothetical protein
MDVWMDGWRDVMGAQVFHTNKFQFVGSCLNIVNNVVQLLQARAGRARSALRHEALRQTTCNQQHGCGSRHGTYVCEVQLP